MRGPKPDVAGRQKSDATSAEATQRGTGGRKQTQSQETKREAERPPAEAAQTPHPDLGVLPILLKSPWATWHFLPAGFHISMDTPFLASWTTSPGERSALPPLGAQHSAWLTAGLLRANYCHGLLRPLSHPLPLTTGLPAPGSSSQVSLRLPVGLAAPPTLRPRMTFPLALIHGTRGHELGALGVRGRSHSLRTRRAPWEEAQLQENTCGGTELHTVTKHLTSLRPAQLSPAWTADQDCHQIKRCHFKLLSFGAVCYTDSVDTGPLLRPP